MNRRDLLRAVGAGTAGGLAGCTGAPSGGEPTDEPTTEGDGQVIDGEVVQFGVVGGVPDWYDDGRPGRVVVVDSADRLRATVSLGDLSEDRRGAVRAFLEGVDYDRDRLLYVHTGGPDTCHSRVAVEDLTVADGRLTGRARAVDTSEPAEGCGDALAFPAALVRVGFDGRPADTVALRVADGFGTEATVTASVDDPLAPDPEDLAGVVRPDEPADPVAALSCGDPAFRRHPAAFDEDGLAWGDVTEDGEPRFGLRVDRPSYEHGDRLLVRLRTLAETRASTGNRHKYNLQVRTEVGWQDVRGTTDDTAFAYTDEAVQHRPGEGFTWTLGLTPEGVLAGHDREDRLTVCPGLPAGRYRFVYWGVPDAGAVAVGFDLE